MSRKKPRHSLWYAFEGDNARRLRVEDLPDDEPSVGDIQDEIINKERSSCAASTITLKVKAPEDDKYKLLDDALFQKHEENFFSTVTKANKKRWTVNSAIPDAERNNVYFVDPMKESVPLLDMIRRGEFVALYGARASGKSTRTIQAMEQLIREGFICVYITLELINMESVDKFWISLGHSFETNDTSNIDFAGIKSASEFARLLGKDRCKKEVVLFVDEYDVLYEADDDVRASFLGTIRGIKNAKRNYSLWSSVAVGPFSILHLSSNKSMSPFNVKDPFQNPNFTKEQVQSLYRDFAHDYNFIIDPAIIEDIYTRTNGHAGLVCLCGKAIYIDLIRKLDERRQLDFLTWLNFAIISLQKLVLDYATFRKMVHTLTKDKARQAMQLVRSAFIGFFDLVHIVDNEERNLAEFLTAEGVLIRDEESKDKFKMSSALVDELIRQRVIPELFKSTPAVAVPEKRDGFLDIINILKTVVQFFDQDIISRAFYRSFKTAHDIYVNSQKNKHVPRESTYDAEMNRILINWISKQRDFEVTCQWHLVEYCANEKYKHTYSDIVIKTPYQTVVLELLATATRTQLNEHFVRAIEYGNKLCAEEVWIVHFTCEDNSTQNPYYPPSAELCKLNIVHFLHDEEFKNVRMSARFMDSSGSFSHINDELIIEK
ncbi:10522_t:CDS:2 [Paraglomus brasilianum]|uniref:10522_t:CDS:1 n=1 Tax=Paraglomus brasilianum TaxID=144538 RepID=A0A9N9F6N3_9GLOM|nr:10522_t:CDS:2 [Paraglomus brasilianum]